jgi:hypothetical protein
MTTSQAQPGHDQLSELLHICEDFFRNAGPATLTELDTILRERGITGGPGWLIDMLGLTRPHLQHQHETTTSKPEN